MSADGAAPIRLSIRQLAEFLLRTGSIDAASGGARRAAEGSRIHRMLQRQGGAGYKAEVSLSIELVRGGFCYQLAGRADGIMEQPSGITVDEIKTITLPASQLQENSYPAHWAQGCLYAYILCRQRGLSAITVQLSYYLVDSEQVVRFQRPYTAEALAAFTEDLLAKYHRWAKLSANWAGQRNESLHRLAFPFPNYRAGQRELAVACYNTFQQRGRLYCCAPTGTGKTAAVLFAALKAMGEGQGGPIFYLTAKTIARQAAENAIQLLEQGGRLALRSLTLTAKDKICFLEQRNCTPEACPWAEGYYNRINDALYAILSRGGPLTRPRIEQLAREHRLCPYELSLDLATFCDCVICDYNYLFDPTVHLQRFFETTGDYLFLVDEAHNLVDRSRDMHSATLRKSSFWAFKKQLPKSQRRLHGALAALNTGFVALRKRCELEGSATLVDSILPPELEKPLERFLAAADAYLEQNRGSEEQTELLALYFNALFYSKVAEWFDERYITLVHAGQSQVSARLQCLDASSFVEDSLALGRAAVLFSATLLPLPYYKETLGGAYTGKMLQLESPFPHGHLGLFVAENVSTKYAARTASLPDVVALLAQMVRGRVGNYIAYFPSYRYMQDAVALFCHQYPDIPLIVQSAGMDETARERFLASFATANGETLLGFCVLGGVFAEGVDLPGERLIGAAVVGVGLPQISPVPDAIRRYYNERTGDGFAYAYQYPGMNKVLQAVGRVIRSGSDKGVALLVDDRFVSRRYQQLFPAHWAAWQPTDARQLPAQLQAFWQQQALATPPTGGEAEP